MPGVRNRRSMYAESFIWFPVVCFCFVFLVFIFLLDLCGHKHVGFLRVKWLQFYGSLLN